VIATRQACPKVLHHKHINPGVDSGDFVPQDETRDKSIYI